MSKKTNGDVAGIGELLQMSTRQARMLDSGKGDITTANAIATQVRSHVSLIGLAMRLHKMGSKQNILGLAAPKKIE